MGLYLIDSDVEKLIKSLKVMTLATPWEGGIWSAPLYYLYKNQRFYFFSSPTSKHIVGAFSQKQQCTCENDPKNRNAVIVAASIFQDDADFHAIKGIQMQGRVDVVPEIRDAMSIAVVYAVKFNLMKMVDFSKKSLSLDLLDILKRQFHAELYQFIPSQMIYMDNSVRIGFKKEISLCNFPA